MDEARAVCHAICVVLTDVGFFASRVQDGRLMVCDPYNVWESR